MGIKTIAGVALGAAVLLIGVPVGCSYLSTVNAVATAPSRVANRTLQTDNIINNYEAFFDIKAQFDVRVPQVRDQLAALRAETDPAEKTRLRVDLRGVQQSCRDLAQRYNANALKANRGIFRDHDLPTSLDVTACEE